MKEMSCDEIRERVLKNHNVKLEGRIYRVQFTFKNGGKCYTKKEDSDKKEKTPSVEAHIDANEFKSRYILRTYDLDDASEYSDLPFEELEGLKCAFKMCCIINKYKAQGLEDGKIILDNRFINR